MRNFLLIVIAVVLAAYLTIRFSTMYKSRGDLEQRVDYQLDFVDSTSTNSVKQDLVRDAQRFGIALAADDIHVLYEDTEQRSVAQQIVGDRLGTQFSNKRVVISAAYTVPILGIPVHQSITRSKIKQVTAPRPPPSKALQELLDTP